MQSGVLNQDGRIHGLMRWVGPQAWLKVSVSLSVLDASAGAESLKGCGLWSQGEGSVDLSEPLFPICKMGIIVK